MAHVRSDMPPAGATRLSDLFCDNLGTPGQTLPAKSKIRLGIAVWATHPSRRLACFSRPRWQVHTPAISSPVIHRASEESATFSSRHRCFPDRLNIGPRRSISSFRFFFNVSQRGSRCLRFLPSLRGADRSPPCALYLPNGK